VELLVLVLAGRGAGSSNRFDRAKLEESPNLFFKTVCPKVKVFAMAAVLSLPTMALIDPCAVWVYN
jgi:hypothetical protein